MHDGAMAGREQFFCCVFWTDWEACAGGRVGGRSVGRAVQLGWARLPPRLSRLGRHSVGSVGNSSRLGSWAGAGAGAEKRRLPRESRDTSGDIRRDGRQT